MTTRAPHVTAPLVALNGLFLDHPHTGTGVYTRELFKRLSADESLHYAIVGHSKHASEWAAQGAYRPLDVLPSWLGDKAEKVVWEQLALPWAVKRLHADLLYAPYFSLPLVPGARTVVTVHDLIPLLLPEYAPSIGFKAYFRLVGAATRRASAVVTDSQHSAGDICRVLNVPPERVHVVHLGVDAAYSRPIEEEEVKALRRRLGLPDRFILYLGGTDPRKNVNVLLRAAHLARQRGRHILPLAIVAPSGRSPAAWARYEPRSEATRLGLDDKVVIFLDWIADEDKPVLYAAATAFAYPSRYEGFGLPLLEAMASGTAVVCASSSSLPEIAGDAALLLDPDDVDGWADALVRMSEDDDLRDTLVQQGSAQAQAFTWDNTVKGLRAVFAQALG